MAEKDSKRGQTPMDVDKIMEAEWVIPIIPKNTVFKDHAVVVKEGRIFDILPRDRVEGKYRAAGGDHWKGGPSTVLLPGLINAHTHAAMTLLRSYSDDVPLMEWLTQYIWPAEGAHVSAEFCEVGVRLAVAEMLRCGVTTFSDMYFFPEVTARVVRECGVRALVGIPVICFPNNWAQDGADHLAKGKRARAEWEDKDHVTFCLAPHAPYTVDDATFASVRQLLADESGLRMHIHLHETAKEVADGVEKDGVRPIARLDRLGVLTDRVIAVHMTALNEEEKQILLERGISVIHCPESNLKLASGILDVADLVRRGVNVGLGTDGPACNDDQDILGEVRTASLLSSFTAQQGGGRPLPPHVFLEMATINNARALGLDDRLGSLEVGKAADIVALHLLTEPVYNPIKNVAHVGTNEITDVWVAGRHLLRDRIVTCLDEPALRQAALEWKQKISKTYKPVITESEHPSLIP
mmetsp:Transcript_29500/g.82394  ORF Transcript_29500/g.82394 Transcript_29500/m.82394 type:complete len:467 (+) Transcript_29500:351-1751(+)|eukprot:CAMPEP_0119133264 /NCGR_PEP_ID=MMETSP1310-20130426/13286_1 /TAXON_ID=464262 /ORGANISM="Genus nov. species nov., Strain RCC2339" /LENGTH=466 /DNA_ID=CAMNT_0007123951 /DNA_START=266 /DNA_END=1666 /DNA_ORIENTATION=-